MQDFYDLIKELEKEIKSLRKIPTHKKEKLENIVHTLKSSLPDVVEEANYFMQNLDNQKRSAINEANNIVTKARITADSLIENSQIIREAENTASNIVNKAKNEVDTKMIILRENADKMLAEVESKMANALSIITKERHSLKNK